jgi:hypothetical protein
MATGFCCFWASGEAEHHGGEHVVDESRSLHGRQEAERVQGKDVPFTGMLPVTYLTLPIRPHCQSFHFLPIMPLN